MGLSINGSLFNRPNNRTKVCKKSLPEGNSGNPPFPADFPFPLSHRFCGTSCEGIWLAKCTIPRASARPHPTGHFQPNGIAYPGSSAAATDWCREALPMEGVHYFPLNRPDNVVHQVC